MRSHQAPKYRVQPECAVCGVEPVSRTNSATCSAEVCRLAYQAARQRVKRDSGLTLDEALAEVSGRPMPRPIAETVQGFTLAGTTRTSRKDDASQYDASVPSLITVNGESQEEGQRVAPGGTVTVGMVASTTESGAVDLGMVAVWPSAPAMRENVRQGAPVDLTETDGDGWQSDLAQYLRSSGGQGEGAQRAAVARPRLSLPVNWTDDGLQSPTLDEYREGVRPWLPNGTEAKDLGLAAVGRDHTGPHDTYGDRHGAATPRRTRFATNDPVADGVAGAVDGWSDHRPNIADGLDVLNDEAWIDWTPVVTETMLADAKEIEVDLHSDLGESRQTVRRARAVRLRAELPTVAPVTERRVGKMSHPLRPAPETVESRGKTDRAGIPWATPEQPEGTLHRTACPKCKYHRDFCRC